LGYLKHVVIGGNSLSLAIWYCSQKLEFSAERIGPFSSENSGLTDMGNV